MQRIRFIIAIDIVLLALFVFGIYRAGERAVLPPHLENLSEPIVLINGTQVHSNGEAEFFVSQYRIGSTANVTYADGRSEALVLRPYYGLTYTIIQSFTAFIYALLGIFILLRKKGDALSRQFHYLTFALAVLITHTTGSFSVPSPTLSIILETLFYLSYSIAGVLFLRFIFTFGRYPVGRTASISGIFAAFGLALAAVTTFFFIRSLSDIAVFPVYDAWLKWMRVYFGILFISGLGVLIHAIRTRREPALNRQLRWILYGCTISILAYIALWQVPIILDQKDIISEETMLVLAVIAPIAIAIGIVRHKLFDIDLLIRKSVSYALLVVVIIGVYSVSVMGISFLAHKLDKSDTFYPAATAAIIAALAFEPLRRKVFTLVDQKFFRASYDLRQAQRQFIADTKQALDIRTLGLLAVERIQQLIPLERIGFFVLNEDVRRMRLVAHEGFGILERHGVSFTPEDLKTRLEHPVALPEYVEETVIEVADRPTFERWKIALVVPMLKEGRHPLGFIVLGKRRSETRFTADDLELVTEVASQSATVLERLLLQQQLLIEQAESLRLDELNRLKSYFVSSVTHDLKTPLTSIRLYAELLRSALPEETKANYLTTIEGETDRLARLITNVLDFARIEQGTKAYFIRPVDLTEIARNAIELLHYQITSLGFALTQEFPTDPAMIRADRDAIGGVIINLISNVLKYSEETKCIHISVTQDRALVTLVIADRGIGMDEYALAHVFEPFYRVSQNSGSGAGLGLSIVKHTLDAHHASVDVKSSPGNGTTFTITFSAI